MSDFFTSDKARLHYSDEGSSRAVVLVAGYGAGGDTWIFQKKALLEAGFRVIVFDRRSHGFSENTPQGQRLCRHAADLWELIRFLGLEKPLLVGQSMGASTLFAYLSVFGDKDLSGVVAIDQTPKMISEDDWDCGMYGLTRDTMGHFFDTPLPQPFFRDPAEFLAPLLPILAQYPAFDLVGTRPLLYNHAFEDWRDVFPHVGVPMLFIAGADSPFWSARHAGLCAGLCQNGRSAVVPDCGHAVQWERPEECSALILGFAAEAFET